MSSDPIPDPELRRVLVYRLGSLGDMAIAIPVLRLVRRAFPKATVRLLTNQPVHAKAPAAAAVLEGSGLVDGFVSYPVGTRSLTQLGGLWLQLRSWRPQAVVYLAAARGVAVARRDARFFRACGVRAVFGVPWSEALQANCFGLYPSTAEAQSLRFAGALEPEAQRLARCVTQLGDARLNDLASWSLGLTENERQRADGALGAVDSQGSPVAVCVGTKVQAKDWGVSNWQELLARVAPMVPGRPLVLLGSPEEEAASGMAAEGWRANQGGPVVNLCGRLTPRESAAVLELCTLFLGHDSGPMHLAASVGTPVVAVFAARNIPRQWFPAGHGHEVLYHRVECWGCELETCVEQRKKCLLSITVEEVADAVQRVLQRLGT